MPRRPRRIVLEVITADLRTALASRPDGPCPLQVAADRLYPYDEVGVGSAALMVGFRDALPLPEAAREYAARWDAGLAVGIARFEVVAC